MANLQGTLATHEFVQRRVTALRKLSVLSPVAIFMLVFIFILPQLRQINGETLLYIALPWTLIFGIAISLAVEFLIYTPLRLVKFNECLEKMKGDLAALAFNASQVYQTRKPLPALIAVNRSSRKLYLQNSQTEYKALVLDGRQILSAKVEREMTMHTDTSHGSGSSHSSTRVQENAFLEIYYDVGKDAAPALAVIPFGSDRRTADGLLLAIEQIRGN